MRGGRQALSIDEKGNFTPAWVSPNIFAMTGFHPEETLSFGWWKKTIHEEDRERVIKSNSQLQKVDELVVEFRVYRKDGSILWVRDAKRILRNQDGKRFELVGAWSDITERVELEEQSDRRGDARNGRKAGGRTAFDPIS
ncbi:MAG: PAS domain-containing protein [Blastocatellia bacterium]|nr:PAS domain-containing protein [Blastocatellia bacterium]